MSKNPLRDEAWGGETKTEGFSPEVFRDASNSGPEVSTVLEVELPQLLHT